MGRAGPGSPGAAVEPAGMRKPVGSGRGAAEKSATQCPCRALQRAGSAASLAAALVLSFAPRRSRLREDTHRLCSLLQAPHVCFHPSELCHPNARRLPAASSGDRSPSLPKYKETSLHLKNRAHPVAPSSACHLAAYGAALASNTFREVH